ncbi:hypothetical protein [Pantoea sp. 1.19]|uniref:hypothetical protein n=1 Tax=Pantoea sp. 1.19 TaxID=1925589 RepID=UPI000948E2D1|nr:hypothetical protein [Pantoea sp. 1.19]
MKVNRYSLLLLLSGCISVAQADEPLLTDPHTFHLGGQSADDDDDSLFPIGHRWAEAHGYTLPETWGLNVSWMDNRQNVVVDSIHFSNLNIPVPGTPGIDLPDDFFIIHAGKTREVAKTTTARLDGWLFPFMNVYAVVGHTHGHSNSTVGVCGNAGCDPLLQNIDFQLDFKGTTWGGGTTFAWGYKNLFVTADMNWTRTHFDILDGNIKAYTFTPRVGWRMTLPEWATLTPAPSTLALWVGTMYQDTQQEFRGKLSDLKMPAQLGDLVNFVNSTDAGHFEVKQHLKSPWNVLVGAQYALMPQFNLVAEVGFAERNSLLLSGEYRF